jgi:hypothetical protein
VEEFNRHVEVRTRRMTASAMLAAAFLLALVSFLIGGDGSGECSRGGEVDGYITHYVQTVVPAVWAVILAGLACALVRFGVKSSGSAFYACGGAAATFGVLGVALAEPCGIGAEFVSAWQIAAVTAASAPLVLVLCFVVAVPLLAVRGLWELHTH